MQTLSGKSHLASVQFVTLELVSPQSTLVRRMVSVFDYKGSHDSPLKIESFRQWENQNAFLG